VRDFVRAYLSGEAAAFFPAHPLDPDARRRAVLRARRPIAPALHDALVRQNQAYAASPARDRYLAELARGAAAVVTGQQVGLFLGPLYTLYKAASAVVVARRLAEESGTPVVPIFWLQTEDHDLVEIASCGLPGLTISLPASAENRVSVAHLRLPPEIEERLGELADFLGDGVHAKAHVARLRRHYRPGVPWAAAFAGLLAELFAPEGLVLIDPRDPALAPLAAPVHERALRDAEPIADALAARAQALAAAGFEAPVHVRPDAALSFVHDGGPEGPRRRALPGDAGQDPRLYSTSALLRPILEATLLPSAAYVGGPAEVAYFAQLGPLYEHYGLAMPLVVPRARFTVIDARARRLLERLGLEPADLARTEAELLARLCPPAERATALVDAFQQAHAALSARLGGGDPAIARALLRTHRSVSRALERLDARLTRAAAYRDGETVAALRRLIALLAPPQERRLGLPALVAPQGDRELVEKVLAAIDPFEPSLKEIA